MSKLTTAIKELPETPTNARLKAIISLLVFQGLRQVEIIRLDIKDIDFISKTAFIQGKGQDDKEPINLHPEAIKAIQGYLKSNKIADGALFTSQSNNNKNQRLTTRAIRDIVKKTLNDLGIEKTTHGFRHYFTTTLIKTYKGDLLEVAQYTRHKSLEMLQVYNDNINRKADLPRYYQAFSGVKL
jgi:integrase